MYFRRKVQHGQKNGRKIGFPTLNLNPGKIIKSYSPGVYACQVFFEGKKYGGALHLGPKMGSKKIVLEIHLLHFHQTIYGHFVQLQILEKIREAQRFKTLETLKRQIQKDLKSLSKILTSIVQ